MRNFDKQWTRAEAVQAMFFADDSILPSGMDSKRMGQIIAIAFGDVPVSAATLGKEQLETVMTAVQAVKLSMTTLTPKSQLHSVLWTRWGLRQSCLTLSNSFMLDFARWRAEQMSSSVWVMVYKLPERSRWMGRATFFQSDEKLVGYTLDQVIAEDKFSFDEYSVKWKIRKKHFTTIQRKLTSRATVEVCGKDVVNTLRDCVQAEATRGKLGVLSRETRDGRYESSVSPVELISSLKVHYPVMRKYSDNTLKRGLPEFVRSPRGRPGGPRSNKV